MSATEEHRPSAAERHHELAMAALHRAPSAEFEKEITLNAKGDVQFRTAGKSDDPAKLAWVDEEFDRLSARYPRNGAA